MRKRWLPVLLAALVAVPVTAYGAGFSLYEQGGRALGSAGAFTARVGDVSGIFFNPAGLAQIENGELQLGTSLIYVTREFAGVNPYPGYGVHEESPKSLFYPSHVYWGQKVASGVTVGFGIYNPFGLTTEWENPDEFSGRFLSTKASLTPFYFNPTVAFELTPGLRMGVGLMAVHSSLELRRHVGQVNPQGKEPFMLDLGTVILKGSNDLDFGGTFGLQLDLGDRATMGVNYRSRVSIDYEGDADFTYAGSGTELEPEFGLLFPSDQDVSTALDYPAQLILGLAVQASSKLWVEADLGWTQWSSFDELPINFEDEDLSSVITENWKDAFFYRFGAEYALNADTDLRFGYYFDQTPQPTVAVSPLLPDGDRHGISLGLGKTWGALSADVFALVLIIPERDTEGLTRDGYDGKYSNGVQIAGLTFGYRY